VLVIAHPGHELRVHGWLGRARPRVLVLTDGSGRSGTSRLDSTRRLLDRAAAPPGALFGRSSDQAMYEAMLAGDVELFRALARELATCLADADYVVGDAAEGYNPTHDVCRLLIDAAAAHVGRGRGRPLPSFAFPLVGPPCAGGAPAPGDVELVLDDAELERKLGAAAGYPELVGEVEEALRDVGKEAFRREALRRVEHRASALSVGGAPPFYERHGERRVAEGAYASVLRRREHVLPIAESLACGF
jgi:hypothetical protein